MLRLCLCFALLVASLIVIPAPVNAEETGDIFVHDAWLLTEDGQNGTVYVTIANEREDTVALQSVTAAHASVTLTPMDAEPPVIAAGEMVTLTPDTIGLYVTAADETTLEDGVVVTLTFTDEHDEPISVLFAALPVDTPPEPSAVVVLAGWARPTALDAAQADDPAAVISGAYLTLENRGEDAETLVSVASPVISAVEIHETQVEDGLMRMRPLAALTLEPGERHALEAGGDHLMLIGLERHLLPNDALPLVLTFESGLEITVAVPVLDEREPATEAPEPAEHSHSHH